MPKRRRGQVVSRNAGSGDGRWSAGSGGGREVVWPGYLAGETVSRVARRGDEHWQGCPDWRRVAGREGGDQQTAGIVGPIRCRPAVAVGGGGVMMPSAVMVALVGERQNDARAQCQQQNQGPGTVPSQEHGQNCIARDREGEGRSEQVRRGVTRPPALEPEPPSIRRKPKGEAGLTARRRPPSWRTPCLPSRSSVPRSS